MRKHHLVENLTFVLSLNIVQFITTYYLHRVSGEYKLSDIIFDAIFTVLYAAFFIIVFSEDRSLLPDGALKLRGKKDKKTLIIKFFGLILLRCVLDIVLVYIVHISAWWKYIGTDVFVIIYFCIVYFIAASKENAIWKNKKCYIGCLVLIVVALGAVGCYDAFLIDQYNAVSFKYTESSPYLARTFKNLDFLHSIKLFVLETVLIVILTVFHTVCSKDNNASDSENKQSGFRTFIRCDIIAFLMLILFVAKMVVAPSGVIVIDKTQSSHSNYEEQGPFDITVNAKSVLYGMVEFTEDKSYYYIADVLLQKNNVGERFALTGKEPDTVFTDEGSDLTDCILFSIDGQKVYLYDGYYAVCYYENGSPRIIRTDHINQCESNAVITKLFKHLIKQGNLFAFEYAGEYLAKYEPDFIQPYIERYSNGVFNKVEKQWLGEACYREDYIIDMARGLIK